MSVRAKFRCHEVAKTEYGESVKLGAVYSTDENDVNRAWAKATPSGSLTMQIDNPEAWGRFTPGKEYFLTLSEAE